MFTENKNCKKGFIFGYSKTVLHRQRKWNQNDNKHIKRVHLHLGGYESSFVEKKKNNEI